MSIVNQLVPLFANNAHAVRFYDGKRGKWNYRKVGRPLDAALLTQHISKDDPEFSLGAYVLRDLENSRGHALILDLDDHDGTCGPLITATAVRLCDVLEELALPYMLFRSGGGRGFHFYLLFQELQAKSQLRTLGKHLVYDKLKMTEGPGGVAEGQIEIFPKGDSPGGENVIALPMARKSVALRRDGDNFVEAPEPTEIAFCPLLPGIRGAASKPRSAGGASGLLAELCERADAARYTTLFHDQETGKLVRKNPGGSLTPELILGSEHPIWCNFSANSEDDKSSTLVIRTPLPEKVSQALGQKKHFIVSSQCEDIFYVWVAFSTPHRRDWLRKIGIDALADAEDCAGEVWAGGKTPIEIPLSGASRYVTGFSDGRAIYGDPPTHLPVNDNQKPGPKTKAKSADRDKAFECLGAKLDPSDYDQWVKCGHLLKAAFGDDAWAFERWSAWSGTAVQPDTAEELQRKWERDLKPKCSPASFWLAAKEAGYDGALPFGKTEERKFRAVDLVSGIELFRSSEGVSFATVGPRHHIEVRSRAFEQFTRLQTLEDAGELMSAEDIKAVVETIDAQCQKEGKRVPVHLRIARGDTKGYLFLGDDDHTVVEYGPFGFQVCEQPPVRFRSVAGSKPIPMPVPGALETLRQQFNVDDENWIMLLAWLVMTLVNPGRPTPICVLNGEHGSAKTTALRQIVDLLDPKVGATAGPPKSEDDLIASAYACHVVSFDNVSSFAALSDPLCRLATGGGLRKRQLFTDNSLAAYDVIRPVIVSGIDPTAYNLDIVERLFTIELVRPEIYLTEAEVSERFAAALPSCLGALLTLAGQVMGILPTLDITARVRMADFAKVGEAVARLTGRDDGWFLETYQEMLESAAAANSEGDPVFNFLESDLVHRFASIQGQLKIGSEIRVKASELHARMMQQQRDGAIMANREDVPRNARVFSSRIFRTRKQLEESGFEVEQSKSDRQWIFAIGNATRLQEAINKQAVQLKVQGRHDDNVPF